MRAYLPAVSEAHVAGHRLLGCALAVCMGQKGPHTLAGDLALAVQQCGMLGGQLPGGHDWHLLGHLRRCNRRM
jgi:hypothetical protein